MGEAALRHRVPWILVAIVAVGLLGLAVGSDSLWVGWLLAAIAIAITEVGPALTRRLRGPASDPTDQRA